jgi:hypothetical protein
VTEKPHTDTRPDPLHPTVVARRRLGPFTPALVFEESDGRRVIWSSRRNRKGLDPEPAGLVARSKPRHALPIRPASLNWWMATLFMMGSALFAVGAAIDVSGMSAVAASGRSFFVGSLFFTTAAYLQLLEVVNEPDALTKKRPSVSLWRWEPEKIGWWAVFLQLLGTLLFNISTFEAMRVFDPLAEDHLVWAPDAMGSICFLVASYLAYVEACRRWVCWQPRNISWWVVAINLLGSVAFGVSAVASLVILPTGEMLDPFAVNLWTLIGAICFFLGAYLLLPEMTAHSSAQPS